MKNHQQFGGFFVSSTASVGWVERSDTHQISMMGIAKKHGSTHPTGYK
jgi:hypothetical protein